MYIWKFQFYNVPFFVFKYNSFMRKDLRYRFDGLSNFPRNGGTENIAIQIAIANTYLFIATRYTEVLGNQADGRDGQEIGSSRLIYVVILPWRWSELHIWDLMT